MKYDKKAGLLIGALLIPFAATAQKMEFSEMFKKYDMNHDGYHDAGEFLKSVEQDTFKVWDLDGNGVLTVGEMMTVAKMPASIPAEGKRSLISWCDIDLDSKCTLDEVKRYARTQLVPRVDQDGDGRFSEQEARRFYDGPGGGMFGP